MEDKDIKLIKEIIKEYSTMDGLKEYTKALEKLLQAYKEDEKVIEEMAKTIYEDDGSWNMHNKYNVEEIIDYFRKKCE